MMQRIVHCVEYMMNDIDMDDNRLSSVEVRDCQCAFLQALYTPVVYNQWIQLKSTLNFDTEWQFVRYVLECVINHARDIDLNLNINDAVNICTDWLITSISQTHSDDDGISCESMLMMMYGAEVYVLWKRVKSSLGFTKESEFVKWIINAVTCSPSGHVTECGTDQRLDYEENDIHVGELQIFQQNQQQKKYCCKICPFTSHSKLDVVNHMPVHCKKTLYTENGVKVSAVDLTRIAGVREWGSNQNNEGSQCKVCYRNVSSESLLTRHITDVHLMKTLKNRENMLRCDESVADSRNIPMRHTEINPQTPHKFKEPGGKRVAKNIKRSGLAGKTRTRPPFLCYVCGAVYNLKKSLKKHTLRHHSSETNGFVRRETSKTRNSSRKQVSPVCDATKDKGSIRCSACTFTALHEDQLVDHMHVAHNRELHSCEKCPAKFNIRKFYLRHQREAHPECRVCGEPFTPETNIEEHMTLVHGKQSDGSFVCVICGKAVTSTRFLLRHLRRIHGRGQCCEICGKFYQGLTEHMRSMHSNVKDYLCTLCPAAFKFNFALMRHVKFIHEKPTKSFSCDQCSHKFVLGHHLKQHLICVHNADSPHQCHICHKYFPWSSHLQNHIKKHQARF